MIHFNTNFTPCRSAHRLEAVVSDPMLKPLLDDDYIAIGLACCFAMDDNNKLQEAWIYEPLTAGR